MSVVTGRQVYFYCTADDIRGPLASLVVGQGLKFVKRTFGPETPPDESDGSGTLPEIGDASSGDVNLQPMYLILRATALVRHRVVPQRRGGSYFAVDEVCNPEALILVPGGVAGDKSLVVSKAMAVGNAASLELYRQFTRTVLKGFRKVDSYYLGPEAMKLWEQGWRLTHSVGASPEFDLQRGGR